jgi:nitrous oxide reductase accessory protein NosL
MLVVALAVALVLAAGCARTPAEPRVRLGTPCVTCGMNVQDLRFACLRREKDGDRQYDSIECLVKDAAGGALDGERLFLADYDEQRLHDAESVWVVKGDFPTPMGGGLAAFATLESAREVADRTHGHVGRLHELAPEVTP